MYIHIFYINIVNDLLYIYNIVAVKLDIHG